MMNEHPHILVVDDEPQITRVLRTTLTAQGYEIRVANDGEMALEIMKDWTPNLIITDLSMPQLDGVQLCRRVRAVSQVPILVLSVRDQERQKIEALDAGADDYITKPFSMNELLARVRANLRRTPKSEGARRDHRSWRLPHRPRNPHRGRRWPRTQTHPKEFDLLLYLSQHPRRVIPHRTLLAAVWGANSTEQPEYLRVFIGQLRKKVEQDPAEPRYLLDRALGRLPLRSGRVIFTISLFCP